MINIVLEEELLGSQWVANLDKLYRKHLSTTRGPVAQNEKISK